MGDGQLVNACRFLWRHLSIVQKWLHALPTITSPYSEAPTNYNWTLPMNPPIHQHHMSTLQQVIIALTILGHTVVDTENLQALVEVASKADRPKVRSWRLVLLSGEFPVILGKSWSRYRKTIDIQSNFSGMTCQARTWSSSYLGILFQCPRWFGKTLACRPLHGHLPSWWIATWPSLTFYQQIYVLKKRWTKYLEEIWPLFCVPASGEATNLWFGDVAATCFP